MEGKSLLLTIQRGLQAIGALAFVAIVINSFKK